MNLLRFIPIKLTLLLVVGILLGRHLLFDSFLSMTITGINLILLGILFYREQKIRSFDLQGKGSLVFGIAVALTTVSLGSLAVSLTDAENSLGHYSHKTFEGRHLWKVKIREELKSTTYSDRYMAQLMSFENEKVSGSMLLSLSRNKDSTKNGNDPLHQNGSNLRVDDELTVLTALQPIDAPLNPHQFDYRKYMESLGVKHQMRLNDIPFITSKNPQRTLYGIAASLRDRIITKLREADFGKEELGIIQALLLGRRNDISTETYDNYKNAGAVHILAVSGLHIGILLLLLRFLLRPLERLPKGKTIKLILIVALLWSFAVLAGLSASVVRAVTMFSFVAYALYLNRPGNTFNILALSMFFILLLIDPMLLFQVGFQMSYAAVFAIVWIYPLLQRLWNPKNRIVRYFWQLLSVSIAAQMGVLPISLFYFHQFPGLFFISNLLIVPALGVIFGMGIFVIFLALIGQLPQWIVHVYDTIIRWMNRIIGWVAQQEAFVFQKISFDGIQLVLAFCILLCSVLFLSKPTFKKAVVLAVPVIGFQLWLFHASYRTQQKEVFFVAHQTRNSILIHQKGNHLIAIAAEPDRTERITADYQIAERTAYFSHTSLKNAYRWYDKNLLIVDSVGIYSTKTFQPDYLLLTESPKLNLERVIDSIRPKTIIADGSNYRSYVARWKKTCEERKLPFHHTGEKGAYFFEK